MRRQPPGLNVRAKDGSSLLVHTPAEGIGPWFTCTRAAWHKSQLEAMAKTGVDSALVAYCPDRRSRAWSVPGLAALVQALKEMRDLRRDHPLVALYLDFQYWDGAKLDLSSGAGRSALYGFVRDFYQRVPPDLQLRTAAPNGSMADAAPVVLLGDSSAFEGNAGGLAAELSRQFREEFGCPLLVAGTPEWKERGADFDAYIGLDPRQGLMQNDAGRIRTATVCPGYGEVGASGIGTSALLREGGRSMIASWNALYKAPPDWVVINSWNGYHNGTEVAASRQYGDREQNLVMAALAALARRGEFGVRVISLQVPPSMQARAVARVLVRAQNSGTRTWIKGGAFLRYRWLSSDGQEVGGSGRLALARDVPPRRTETLVIGVATTHDGAAPLDEGRYLLALDLVPSPEAPAMPLATVPVQVAKELPDRAALVSSSIPSIMRSGAVYTGVVTIRNDSGETWAKGLWYITYRWMKNGVPLGGGSDAAPKVPVLAEVEPGETADATVDVAAVDESGQPIPPWTPDSDVCYTIRWEVIAPSGKRIPVGSEAVHVVAADAGAHFPYALGVGSALDADTLYTVKTVVRNIGPDTWHPGEVKLGYHWYYWDGIELVWQGNTSVVDLPMGELKPGQEVLARMVVRTPPYAGQFVLAADVYRNGAWASAGDLSRGNDLGLAYVFVRKGSFLPAHLQDQFDLDGVSSDDGRTDGDFDGTGRCFPAELLPPEVPTTSVRSTLYPCGYLGPASGFGLDCSRSVIFEYPEKRDGAPNFITCKGQKLTLSVPRCRKLHILAAATKDTDADFVLHFSDGTSLEQRITMTAWDKEPRYGGHIAFRAPHRHAGPAGDEPVPCYLVHYELTSDSKNVLEAVTLPNNPNVRIMALTAESW